MMSAVEKFKLPPLFDDAVRAMEREIMRYLVRSTGSREDAMDLFQETWLRAYRAYPTLKSADGLRPWIFRIASNLCRNRVRDKTRRRWRISRIGTARTYYWIAIKHWARCPLTCDSSAWIFWWAAR